MLVNSRWIHVPAGAIQYRALPGDRGETGGGHWCGEPYEGGFVTFCAFLPPTVAAGHIRSRGATRNRVQPSQKPPPGKFATR
jgi:hypothetical protein